MCVEGHIAQTGTMAKGQDPTLAAIVTGIHYAGTRNIFGTDIYKYRLASATAPCRFGNNRPCSCIHYKSLDATNTITPSEYIRARSFGRRWRYQNLPVTALLCDRPTSNDCPCLSNSSFFSCPDRDRP